jgi:hypothetical protein
VRALQLAEFLSRRLVEQLPVGDERQRVSPIFCEQFGLRHRNAVNVARWARSAVHREDDDQRNDACGESYDVHSAIPPAKRRSQSPNIPYVVRRLLWLYEDFGRLSLLLFSPFAWTIR